MDTSKLHLAQEKLILSYSKLLSVISVLQNKHEVFEQSSERIQLIIEALSLCESYIVNETEQSEIDELASMVIGLVEDTSSYTNFIVNEEG
ncbi:hypothetical protein [Vibrio crassostreae]|uniref:hypothetical protein n=1 Tax=Vibrio crassostreae TaxID=246167 RepID=UPI001B30D3D4|nr:hypothetical protein [Vibrio crassostreae]